MATPSQSLGVFAKFPRPRQVKSRLAADTSPESAARLADAFLRDTIERLAHVPARRVLVFTPADQESYFADLARGRYELLPQKDGDLGERLKGFIDEQLARGARSVVVVGTDSPSMPPEFVEQAFRMLRDAGIVIGPAVDGGYYLVGCAAPAPPIFAGIDWGSDRVLSQTMDHVANAGHRLALLPPWYDVDKLSDLRFLRAHAMAMQVAGGNAQLINTLEVADQLLLETPKTD